MAERIFIRKLNEQQWQWRVLGSDNYWTDMAGAGDLEHMLSELEGVSMIACLILPGTQVVTQRMAVNPKEKNHMAKLLPYEMEESVCESIEELHFSFDNIVDGHTIVGYVQEELVVEALDELSSLNCDIQYIFADYMFINSQKAGMTMVVDNGLLITRFADGCGMTIEEDLSEIILHKLAGEIPAPSALTLVALEEDQLHRLHSALPPSWMGQGESVAPPAEPSLEELEEGEVPIDTGPVRAAITEEQGDFWQWMDLSVLTSPLNFRRGKFARKLPVDRWWALWKFPVYVAAAAFLLSFGLAMAEYLAAKSEAKDIRKQIEAVYLKAVPNGRRGDEERRLESLLKESGGSDKAVLPSNFTVLLAGLSKSLQSQGDVELLDFRYSGEQRELQVNFQVKDLETLSQFKEKLSGVGLETGSPRSSLQGDSYRASMKVTEKQ